jgi:predicted CopG family antitoxin
MPKGRYRGISVRAEVYRDLEELRGRLGLRSVADVVEHLLERALKEEKMYA